MKGLEAWYVVTEHPNHPNPRSTMLNAQPFARPQVRPGMVDLLCESAVSSCYVCAVMFCNHLWKAYCHAVYMSGPVG